MPRNIYEPLKLNQTNRYAGYQFYAGIRMDGMSDRETFYYAILSVYRWILEKVPEEDRKAPELQVPAPEEYTAVRGDTFAPFHLNYGFALDITPLTEQGIWALRIKETDSGVEGGREPVVGRFFTTRVGLRLNEKGYTELGIRIDVTDPASEEKEVDYAFRPGFVRSLAVQPAVCFEQVRELKYGQPVRVRTEDDYRQMLHMLLNEDNQLPLAIFTYARPEEKEMPVGTGLEEFLNVDQMESFLRFCAAKQPGAVMPGSPMKKATVSLGTPGTKKKFADDAKPMMPFGTSEMTAESESPVMPYDTERFSRSAFGYALTYILEDPFFDRFVTKMKMEIRPGDILICGAKKFRGGATIVSYPGEKEKDLNKAYDRALLAAQSYSKHKAPYSFGTVVFEAEARKMEQQRELERILKSGQMEEKERYARLVSHVEELNAVIDDKDKKIERIEKQCDEEFDRGVAFRDSENARLEEENSSLKKELAEEREKNRRMLSEHQWAKNIQGALDQMRKMEKLPNGNGDVVRYFCRVYPDRLGFTERGEAEASRCGLRTDHLWEILYMIANDLVDLFRQKEGNLTEEEITTIAGCEVAMQEGSMTRKDNTLMRLREDEYEGKGISVEPHLKLKQVKGEPAHQRLHFCYDPELKKIIIGYLGDHLDSAATQYARKR